MVERYKRGKGKSLLGSHQKCWIWGRHLVLETLAAGRWPIADLFLSDALPADALLQATRRAGELGVPAQVVAPAQLEKLGHTGEHQGYLARMLEFPYTPFETMPFESAPEPVFAVLLDGLQDPHNLGAILRSAEVFGAHGAILPSTGQAGVSSMVARSSAGAVNRISIARVESLDAAAASLQARGIQLVGASEKAEKDLAGCDLTGPVCIAIGNEGIGLSEPVRARCSILARIPQFGNIGSLNAAVAAGIFFYEVRRQRGRG